MAGPRRFTSNCSEMVSWGAARSTSQFGSKLSTGVPRNSARGAALKRMAISVTRAVRCLPVRTKNGTPAQRQLSISNSKAA